MSEDVIKEGMITKRAQLKKSIGPTNYKERVFVLTETKLQYFEGTLRNRGKLKGSILIKDISFVGPIEEDALKRTGAFQVIHSGVYLYCCAPGRFICNDWIDAITDVCRQAGVNLETHYHPKIYSGGKWQCCGNAKKVAEGCRRIERNGVSKSNVSTIPASPYPMHTPTHTLTRCQPTPAPQTRNQLTLTPAPPAPPPRPTNEVEIDVVALYNFTPQEPGDMALYQGQYYTILENTREHWWKARDKHGQEGFVPANYVTDRQKDDVESKDWYQLNLSRQEAERYLLSDASEGAFLIRSSTQPGVEYTLSVISRCGNVNGEPKVKHYHMKQTSKGQFYFSEKYAHDSVLELIYYHQHNSGGLVTRLREAPSAFRTAPPMINMFHNTDWEIQLSELQMERELGKGQFGVVQLAWFRNQQYVAVKMMREGMMEEDSFVEEAKVMAELNHPNLIRLFGVVSRERPICIVTEYMEHGCLLEYIRAHFHILKDRSLDLLHICYQVCDAMAHLESNNFIHRDLAARNCLVGRQLVVKVCDFGLARFVMDDEYTSSQGSKFPIKWAAPEVLNYTKFSSKSDVWAFGILMWEVFSGGKAPYRGMGNVEVVESVVNGHRLERPNQCPHDIFNIMRHTWEMSPESRPAFSELLHTFYNLNDKAGGYLHGDY